MSVVEAAQTAAETNGQMEEKGVVVKGDQPCGTGEISLKKAYEQHVTQAPDPRQKKLAEVTVAGYELILRVQVSCWLDMPISGITRTWSARRSRACRLSLRRPRSRESMALMMLQPPLAFTRIR
ncbi:MAG: hypothetical protein V4586_08210 [Pseudomonadota bacterium]